MTLIRIWIFFSRCFINSTKLTKSTTKKNKVFFLSHSSFGSNRLLKGLIHSVHGAWSDNSIRRIRYLGGCGSRSSENIIAFEDLLSRHGPILERIFRQGRGSIRLIQVSIVLCQGLHCRQSVLLVLKRKWFSAAVIIRSWWQVRHRNFIISSKTLFWSWSKKKKFKMCMVRKFFFYWF